MNYLIAINENGKTYKVMKIVFLNDGGFSFFLPYCDVREGILLKMKQDYSKKISNVSIEEMFTFPMDTTVKISYHYDGFVQFSSAGSQKIISGRDPISGEPKGLGILTKPLNNLITSGPTFGGLIWGIQHYKELTNPKKEDIVLEFSEPDYYYRACSPSNWNAYAIECFLLSRSLYSKYIDHRGRTRKRLTILHRYYCDGPTYFTHRILPEFTHDYLVGVLISRTIHGFRSHTGFSFSGPSDPDHYALHAITDFPKSIKLNSSLIYKPQNTL